MTELPYTYLYGAYEQLYRDQYGKDLVFPNDINDENYLKFLASLVLIRNNRQLLFGYQPQIATAAGQPRFIYKPTHVVIASELSGYQIEDIANQIILEIIYLTEKGSIKGILLETSSDTNDPRILIYHMIATLLRLRGFKTANYQNSISDSLEITLTNDDGYSTTVYKPVRLTNSRAQEIRRLIMETYGANFDASDPKNRALLEGIIEVMQSDCIEIDVQNRISQELSAMGLVY